MIGATAAVRRLGAAVAGSVVAHAATVAAMAAWAPARPLGRVVRVEPAPRDARVDAAIAAAVPIELIALPDAPAPVAAARGGGARVTRAIVTRAIVAPAIAAPAPAAAPIVGDAASHALAMRSLPPGPAAARLRLSELALAALDAGAAAPAASTDELVDRGGGRAVGVDPMCSLCQLPSGALAASPLAVAARPGTRATHSGIGPKGFTAEVAADGTVTIHDRPNLRARRAIPTPRELGRAIAAWADDPYGQSRFSAAVAEALSIERVRRGDDMHVTDKDQKAQRPDDDGTLGPIADGIFDLADWATRADGGDPYAARKLALLDRTRDARARRGQADRADQRDRADQLARARLLQLWARGDLDLAARKQALFELWDDCAETGEPDVVEAGRRARAEIVGFIRAHLRAGSAYTAAELSALDALRTSTARFAPYAEPP